MIYFICFFKHFETVEIKSNRRHKSTSSNFYFKTQFSGSWNGKKPDFVRESERLSIAKSGDLEQGRNRRFWSH